MILLQAEDLELKADPSGLAKGTVVEAKLDRGLGPVATVLIQEGTLQLADSFVAGMYDGKVRAMYNDHGVKVKEAGPSQAVRVQGIGGVPQAGDSFLAAADEREAREIAQRRQQLRREQDYRPVKRITLNDLYQQVQAGEVKELAVVIKGDVDGSVEALSDALFKLSTEKVKVRVIHKGVGAITESDVLLAAASNAIIIGFHVRPEERASELALQDGVDIRLYNIIYEALDAVNKALEGLLEPIIKETSAGRVEVRETFKISGVGTIAGCMVTSGTIARSSKVRLLRDNVVVFDGKIASLKRFKEDVRDVASGFECGVGLENFNDIKQGDVIEAYTLEEVKATL
jgi:translation initiation factor IF-2